MKRKILVLILILVVVGGGIAAWSWFNRSTPEFSLDRIQLEDRMLTRVDKSSIRETIELTGNLSPGREKNLSFPFGAELEEVLVEEGDRVEEGQVLARTDKTRQELDYLRARNNYERALINGTPSEVREQELNLQVAEADLEATDMKAPFSGLVSEVFVETGDRVSSGQNVINLVETDQFKVEVEIDEIEMNLVQVGQEVIISIDAIPGNNFSGVIDRIAFRARDNNGVITLPVTVLLTETHENFRPNLTAELQIIIDEVTDQLVVPLSAVYTMDDQDFVIKVEDGTPVQAPVSVGIDDGARIVIREGLQEGDTILINAYILGQMASGLDRDFFRTGMPPMPGGRF